MLVFKTNNGEVAYETEADCCSVTWFADIIGVCNLLGATVTTVEDVDIDNVDDSRSRQETDKFYGLKITTDKGYADIIYRNSSNGYYGGSCCWLKNFKLPIDNLFEISEDWSA